MIDLVRIDDKLVHAQIIWGWKQALKARYVIVANDEAAHDELKKKMLTSAVNDMGTAGDIPVVEILSLAEAADELKRPEILQKRLILIVSRPADAVSLIEKGVDIESISVGWMSASPGKKRLLKTVFVDDRDIEAFRDLIGKGVSVKYQALLSDAQTDVAEALD